MNMNGGALLTGLGELYESLVQSCGALSVTCTAMWYPISHMHSHVVPGGLHTSAPCSEPRFALQCFQQY